MSNSQYTIVINTYPHPGRTKELKRCLSSLKRQCYQEFTILIIENFNNADGPKKIAKELGLADRTKVVFDPTKKLSYLFNLGWRNTKTEMLAYLADDAEADVKWLEEIDKELSAHKKVGACSGPIISTCFPAGEMHRLYLLSQSNLLMKIIAWPYLHFALEDRVLDPGILLESGGYTLGASLEQSKKYERQEIDLLTTSSMGIRRSALEKVNGFNEKYFFNHADGDLFIRLKKSGFKLIFNPKIISKHHMAIGPSRNAYFIGRDTGRFYRDHIRPHSPGGLIGAFLNVSILNGYWIIESIRQKSTKPLIGIYAFFVGLVIGK